MNVLTFPYQNNINKKTFDYILTCCNQLNNVNLAETISDSEAKEDGYVYLVINSVSDVKLFVGLSQKDNTVNYKSLVDIWVDVQNAAINDLPEYVYVSDRPLIYKFNIKKFYSVLSFSSDYKNRNEITLNIADDYTNIYYQISPTINVILATLDDQREHMLKIMQKLCTRYSINSTGTNLLKVTNVDKNSFLLPFFNHKDCLNFTVSSINNVSKIHKDNNDLYFKNYLKDTNNNINFKSSTLLRSDKFESDIFTDTITEFSDVYISSGVWQILVMLQNSKIWKNFELKMNGIGYLYFINDDVKQAIRHVFYRNNKEIINDVSLDTYDTVGKLLANEMFLLNKLYTNSKNSYYDFSTQKFVGTNYVFSDSKDSTNEIQEIDLINKRESVLPLRLSFTELKHYVGSDLSQKDFIIYVKTDGINVIIEKWNKDETKMECDVLFNHTMSRKYLGL